MVLFKQTKKPNPSMGKIDLSLSRLELENTPTASLQRGKTLQKSVQDMTLNNLMVLFTNPSARAGYDTGSIFKRSLTGFNSEFSFS